MRLQVNPSDRLSMLVAVFNGDPAGRGAEEDPQRRNRHGFRWQMKDRPFAIGEAQLSWNKEKDAAGLPGVLKIGGWYHFGSFDDQRFGADGLSLAVSTADPARHKGNPGFFVLLDQQIVKLGDDRGIGLFARAATMPDDRNLIDFNLDAGLKAWGFTPGRPNDSVGVAVSYGRVSDRASALDSDVNAAAGVAGPVRNYEMALEANYIAQIVPGWSVQPVFQYI